MDGESDSDGGEGVAQGSLAAPPLARARRVAASRGIPLMGSSRDPRKGLG